MSSTATIRMDDDLKARLVEAAAQQGKSAHALILEAIVETVEQIEEDAAFHRLADERWTKYLENGESVPLDEARGWLEARLRGETPPRPTPRTFGR